MSALSISRRRGLIAVLAVPALGLGLTACKPGQTVQNNAAAAPLIVDGNFDEANFVVPDDEGSGDENAAMPVGNGDRPAAGGHTAAHPR